MSESDRELPEYCGCIELAAWFVEERQEEDT